MKCIYKYDLTLSGEQEIEMSEDAQILSVQTQYEKICIWVLFDTKKKMVKRKFIVKGTGHPIEEKNMKYIGTTQMMKGNLVWHVFEDLRS